MSEGEHREASELGAASPVRASSPSLASATAKVHAAASTDLEPAAAHEPALERVPSVEPAGAVEPAASVDPAPAQPVPIEVPVPPAMTAQPPKAVPLWRKVLELVLPVGAAVGVALLFLSLRPSLGYAYHASSTYTGYKQDGWTGKIYSGDIVFCTNYQPDPWVVIDLGKVKKIRRVELVNRRKLEDRAVPLVVEVEKEPGQFVEVARRETKFETWTAGFDSVETRRVRLRVAGRSTWLHLSRVNIE